MLHYHNHDNATVVKMIKLGFFKDFIKNQGNVTKSISGRRNISIEDHTFEVLKSQRVKLGNTQLNKLKSTEKKDRNNNKNNK